MAVRGRRLSRSRACFPPLFALRCVALRPPPPLLLAPAPVVDVPLARNQARHLSGTGCLDVARGATVNGLGFTAIRLRGDAENGRDCAEENNAVG